MKRFSSLLLFTALAALLYINMGDLARISVELVRAKLDASSKLSNRANLQQLIIPLKDIALGEAFFPDKNEVRYHGKLYDIASSKQEGDKIYLQVISDENEDGLLTDLKEHVNSWFNTPQNNTDKKPTLKHTNLLKDFIPVEKTLLSLTRPLVNSLGTANSGLPEFPFIQVIKSPPKIA